jgi:hypothetical protein
MMILNPSHGPTVWPFWRLVTIRVVKCEWCNEPNNWHVIKPIAFNIWAYTRWGALCQSVTFRHGRRRNDPYRWWFAWRPVRTSEGRTAWLRWLQRKDYGRHSAFRTTNWLCRVCEKNDVFVKPPTTTGICIECCDHPDYAHEDGRWQCVECSNDAPYDYGID